MTPSRSRSSKKIVVKLGDLISAAFEVSGGSGRKRAERAALLTEAFLSRSDRRCHFVR